MEAIHWLTAHGFDLVQSASVVGSLLFAAYTFHRDEKARRVSNLIAIQQEYCAIWEKLYERPELARVLDPNVDVEAEPATADELVFIKMLILHLDNVRRAIEMSMLMNLEGMREDVRQFFTLPIPFAVWRNLKQFQDERFVAFVDLILTQKRDLRF